MAGEFEIRKEVELPASPEEVWAAITTRAGLTAWFMPMDVAPAADGRSPAGEGLVWEPPNRFAVRTPAGEGGTGHAFEYALDPAPDGCVLRFLHSGFSGENWQAEYEATRAGWDMYFHTLGQYLRYFKGRAASYVSAEGPAASADPARWPQLLAALGVEPEPVDRSPVCLVPEGLPEIIGIVDYVGPGFLGVRTADAMYRFHGRAGLGMPIAVGHHLYADTPGGPAPDAAQPAVQWRDWLARTFV
jgi:uncharacterized protein YndB with AHSA1/START domain